MKKSKLTKVIAIILVLTMFSASFGAVTVGASHAYPALGESGNPIGVIFADIIDTLLRIVTDFLASLFGNGPTFYPEGDAELADKIAANYYQGTGPDFQETAQPDAKWHLGYANTSLIPDDYDNGTYYIGGYIAPENGFTNVVEGIAQIPGLGKDDMKVRCMSISDGTGNGTVLFAVIDCIGITNADIKDIRELLKEYAADNNIVSINVSSTHTHSCIDTEGLWTRNIAKLVSNGVISGTQSDGDLQQGTNPAYMAWLKDRVANTLIRAHKDMKPGTLTYTTKDIGQDYFQNKNRPTSGQLNEFDKEGNLIIEGGAKIAMTNIERFTFTPDDTASRPTMIINLAAHPDVAGLATESNSGREMSGDYIFYCGQYLDKAGYNFIFFQGAIAGIYMARSATGDDVETQQRVEESQRFGYELARIALSLNDTEEEVKANTFNPDHVLFESSEEISEHTKPVPVFDENGKAAEQVTGVGNNYTVVLDAQGKNVVLDDATKTIKILDGDKQLYELNYSSDTEFTFDEETGSYVVLNGGAPLAIILTGNGGKRIHCPNSSTVAVYGEDTILIKSLPLGRSRVVTAEENVSVTNAEGKILPYVLDTENNYVLAVDAEGMNVAVDNAARTITVTEEINGTPVVKYLLNLSETDFVQYDPTSKTYVIVDTTTMEFIGAVANGDGQQIDYSEEGKIILRDASGAVLGELAIGDRQIVKPEDTLVLPNVFGAGTTAQLNPRYTLWYENWNKNADGSDDVPEDVVVDPILNLYIKQVEIPITNTLITAIGKLNMANYIVKANDDGTYSTVTEVGYMEWGKQFKTVFLPGEICQDLVAPNGRSLYAVNSVTARPFTYYTDGKDVVASSLFGKDVKCFGVMNDAIGYVVPDNDYTMGDPANHYHELISLGQHVASSLLLGLEELKNEIY